MGGLCSTDSNTAVEEGDLDVSRHVSIKNKNIDLGSYNNNDHNNNNNNDNNIPSSSVRSAEEDEFFDAFQSFSDLTTLSYPPAPYLYKARSTVRFEQRESLLHPVNKSLTVSGTSTASAASSSAPPPVRTTPNQKMMHQESTMAVTKCLRESNHSNITANGYPGELDENELNACIRFRDECKKRDPAYLEMVRAFSPAEGEAFALCRFLRARDFDVDAVLNMLEENGATEIWKKRKKDNFFKDNLPDCYNGCPTSVMMALFPIVVSGIAKNGATMFYLRPSYNPSTSSKSVGGMDMNGLECVIDSLQDLIPYMWDLMHHRGIESIIRETNCHNADQHITVLSERMVVVDLKGMPSALYDKTFLGECNGITNCFPETMNRTYMVNVPMAFSVVWAIIKMFIEPRTLQKIGFFSYESKATIDLLQNVDKKELLSNYGGDGPSFEDVMHQRQIEYEKTKRNNKNIKRLIIETIMTNGGGRYGETKFNFELTRDEIVSSIVVYSKGELGAEFNVATGGKKGNVIVPTSDVSKASSTNTADGKKHYSKKIFDKNNNDNNTKISGAEKFVITAKGKIGSGKEYFLITIHVDSL